MTPEERAQKFYTDDALLFSYDWLKQSFSQSDKQQNFIVFFSSRQNDDNKSQADLLKNYYNYERYTRKYTKFPLKNNNVINSLRSFDILKF